MIWTATPIAARCRELSCCGTQARHAARRDGVAAVVLDRGG
jgi:hypothetical protein